MSFVLLMALAVSAIPTKVPASSASQNSEIGNPEKYPPKEYPPKEPRPKACPNGESVPFEMPCPEYKGKPIAVSSEREATPLNPKNTWVTYYDYPTHALIYELEGAANIKLAVDKNGLVGRCSILQTSGFRELDEAACKSVKRNARFHPARDRAGNPTNGDYSTVVRWRMPDDSTFDSRVLRVFPKPTFDFAVPPRILSYDMLRIGMRDYPPDAFASGEQGSVTVRAIVGADGKVVYCRIIASDTKSASPEGPLEKRSCEIVSKKWSFLPAEDGKGQKQASSPEFKFVWAIPPTEE